MLVAIGCSGAMNNQAVFPQRFLAPPDRLIEHQLPGVSFFWLKYRYPSGQFAGAVVMEATALIIARLQATVFGLDEGLVFAGGQKIDDASAHQIPESMIDRLLDVRDLRRLQRLFLTEKPREPSIKGRKCRKR